VWRAIAPDQPSFYLYIIRLGILVGRAGFLSRMRSVSESCIDEVTRDQAPARRLGAVGMGSSSQAQFGNLRRITSGGRFIPEIDGARLLAILLVLNDHIFLQVASACGVSWPGFLTLPDSGTRGVFLFFTISGFILGLPFARNALLELPERERRVFSYRAYLMRRLTRLEPPYVLILVLRLGLLLAVMHVGAKELLLHFGASLFYLHNLIFGSMSPVSPPTWSLEVEVQFYLLAPFLAAVFKIRSAAWRRAFLICVTLGASIFTQIYAPGSPRLGLSLAGNLQYFVAGLLLCDIYITRPFRRISPYAWDLAAIATLVPILWNDSTWTLVLFPLGAVLIYVAVLQGYFVRRFFALPLVSIGGGMCYSVYLTHGAILKLVAITIAHFSITTLPLTVQRVLVIGISLSAVFLVGALVFALVERPCMDPAWPRKLIGRLPSIWQRQPT
jgi:peptidoglycan/LPS O-acetylase OafA/YrhL